MSESAPLNTDKPNVLMIIVMALILGLGALVTYLHFTHKVLNITNEGVSLTTRTPQATPQVAPKVTPQVQAPVVAVEKPVIAQPVVATPTAAKAIQTPTLTPSQASSVVKAAGPYMNHGCFTHGNSNPSWPYHSSHR